VIAAGTLDRAFYDRPVLEVARDLVGCTVRHGATAGVIVETEAYHHTEAASHAYVGLTARTSTLYGPPGIAYVYLNYGIHYLVNAVTEAEGWPAAVLFRALEPKDGIALMRKRRAGGTRKKPADLTVNDLCRGPGNLTKALGIDLRQNRLDLTASALRIEDQEGPKRPLAWSRRIGINVGVEQEWRVLAADSPAVSGRPFRVVRPGGDNTRSRY
jgi:DNA-3-methyladenine glycosylase